jgi:hypothetical protein
MGFLYGKRSNNYELQASKWEEEETQPKDSCHLSRRWKGRLFIIRGQHTKIGLNE